MDGFWLRETPIRTEMWGNNMAALDLVPETASPRLSLVSRLIESAFVVYRANCFLLVISCSQFVNTHLPTSRKMWLWVTR